MWEGYLQVMPPSRSGPVQSPAACLAEQDRTSFLKGASDTAELAVKQILEQSTAEGRADSRDPRAEPARCMSDRSGFVCDRRPYPYKWHGSGPA